MARLLGKKYVVTHLPRQTPFKYHTIGVEYICTVHIPMGGVMNTELLATVVHRKEGIILINFI